MNILDKIVETKKKEVVFRQNNIFEAELVEYEYFGRRCNSLKAELLKSGSSGIIAEFKKRSPSLGDINLSANPEDVTRKYIEAGAAGLSVLTDYESFGGSLAELLKVRKANPNAPLLRKDFIIDKYQLVESKAFGADIILLIAACLGKQEAESLAKGAKKLGMEVLFEIHNSEELEKVNDYIDMIGVNNRNLTTFKVDINTSVELSRIIPKKFIKITESGFKDAKDVRYLKQFGYNGFLIGGAFMVTDNPGEACRTFISEL
jgi:indole-3-glycerol phosphate synthase